MVVVDEVDVANESIRFSVIITFLELVIVNCCTVRTSNRRCKRRFFLMLNRWLRTVKVNVTSLDG